MAYLSANMPFSLTNGANSPKSIPAKYGIEHITSKSFNQDVVFKRRFYVGQSTTQIFTPDVFHIETGKYITYNSFGLFYNRMISSKSLYNFGVITGDKTEKFHVFNGYATPITLDKIELENLTGVRIEPSSGRLPVTIPPYRSIDLRLFLSSSGSAQLNGSFRLHFSNNDQLTLQIKGLRLILWNVKPNWTESVKEQFEYKTDILTSYNKKEQRRGFMVQPRRRVSYTANVTSSQLMQFRNMLHGWQDKAFMMPLWWQPAKLETDVSAGATKIRLRDYEQYDFVRNGSVTLWVDSSVNEVLQIKTINGNELEFIAPISQNFPKDTIVYPSTTVRLNPELQLVNNSSTVSTVEIEAVVVQQDMKMRMPESPYQAEASYKGVEILERKPNWASELNETYQSTIGEIDYGYGVREWLSRDIPSLMQRELEFVAKSYSDILWWKAFIHRQKGALKSFIVPTHTFDAVMVNDAERGENVLVFRDDYLSTIVRNSAERKYLRVKTAKKVYYFTVNALKQSGLDVSITIEEQLPEKLLMRDVQQISFMQRMRFAADDVEIEYVSRNVAKLHLTLQQVREA